MSEIYAATVCVRFNETDLQGHVNFAHYFNYFDVALTGFLRARGYSYQRMLAEGLDLLYVDAHATYQSPAAFEDELRVECRAGNVGNSSIRFDFTVTADEGRRPVATGDITVVMVEHQTHRKVRVPEAVRAALEA